MKNYKCPEHPEKCPKAEICKGRFHDPEVQCPYDVKGHRNDCCVSMGHDVPPMDRNTKGFGKWMREHCPKYYESEEKEEKQCR